MQIPEDVIALADELHAHLEHGDLAGLGPVDLAFDGIWPDPERAARVVLADIAHCSEQDPIRDGPVTATRWRELADQLRSLEGAIHRDRGGQELEQGEARFRLALLGTPVIVFSTDAELRCTWVYNPDHGFSPESFIGKTDVEIMGPEQGAPLAAIKRWVLETGIGTREEVRVTINGDVAYYDLLVEPLRDSAGDIIGVTGATTNITALKRTEEVLARREAQLSEAQRIAQVGSWELDLATNQFRWSDEHYRIFGVDPQVGPLTPAVVQAPIHSDDLEWSRALWEGCLRTGEPYACDLCIVRPDGEVRLIHSRGAMLRDAAGRPQRMVGTAQDITERKQAEEERVMQRERQARLEGLLFKARELAARVKDDLAESLEAIDLLRPQVALPSELSEAIDRLASKVSDVMEDVAALQRLISAPPSQ